VTVMLARSGFGRAGERRQQLTDALPTPTTPPPASPPHPTPPFALPISLPASPLTVGSFSSM
jgi:hypothetical protein